MTIYIVNKGKQVDDPYNTTKISFDNINGLAAAITKITEKLFLEMNAEMTEKIDELNKFLAHYELDDLDDVKDMIAGLQDQIDELEETKDDNETTLAEYEDAISEAYLTLRREYDKF